MTTHLGTYSALVSAAELALAGWLGKEQDAETAMHATNVLAFVLETIDTDQLPADVRQFRAAKGG
uniref:hypothetical protein n=1 Tax=Amycolatopsis benzoatilytica TaxID=346045 RepID=UPI0037C8AF37